jgi:histidyl-tRNA synthetase
MKIITAVRGFKDILPGESEKWQFVEGKAREIFGNFGFREIVLPILEKTELFKRSIGETTDIVEKEMYTFIDRGDESLTMRPEATASVMRAYLEHSLYASDSLVKLYTIGPMFRRERPQKGRFRQFNQLNAELLGSKDPRVDAEVILMLIHFLRGVGVSDAQLEINSLGCPACRPAFREVIHSYLAEKQDGLCEDCQRRLSTNPLRVFDCKVDGCKAIVATAPLLIEFLCGECRQHFESVQSGLNRFDTPFDDTRNDGLSFFRVQMGTGQIIEEKEGLCSNDHDVIDTHGDQVDAHRVVAVHHEGDLQLRPDPVGRRHQDGFFVTLQIQGNTAGKPTEL